MKSRVKKALEHYWGNKLHFSPALVFKGGFHFHENTIKAKGRQGLGIWPLFYGSGFYPQ